MDVCLNMIVKNEAHVIARCLNAAKPHITSWCIVDTGSTDGTQEKIRESLSGIPGELHERPWINQEHNRNEAMDLAYASKPDYVFLIDADEVLTPTSEGASWPPLGLDWYTLLVKYGSIEYHRSQLLSTKHLWRWRSTGLRCRFHPSLKSSTAKTHGFIKSLTTVPHPDGASWSDPDKYKRLLPLAELDILDEPLNARLRYYAAQTHKDAGALQRALELYEERVAMGGWGEEVWSAAYEAAKLRERLKEPLVAVRDAYLRAYTLRPTRSEPLYRLARLCRNSGRVGEAVAYASAGISTPRPPDILFVEHDVYGWRMLNELAMSQHALGLKAEARTTFTKIDLANVRAADIGWMTRNSALISSG